ncbi:unnamed protein product [Leptidea sinapis]|uniref:2-phosphoxylose phosphatase 1 n=1 Tax=Leptidea sinapis TaxID=189913 RepID=A0A5E4PRF4_9NEOP|nr:unnamed protein product [Leptidea sinapis]
MKFTFHHRAFYCYIGMSVWIFFLITVVYKYMTVSEDPIAYKVERSEHVMRIQDKFRKIYLRGCNPSDGIVRGSEGNILREAYGDKIGLENLDLSGKKDAGIKLSIQTKRRLESHPGIKELLTKLSSVLLESQEYIDADVIRDAILAYMCHDVTLPCSKTEKRPLTKKARNLLDVQSGKHLEVDMDVLNMELDYLNQMDFNNEIGRKARDLIKADKKQPLDFDAQMEREKLLYYQQRYLDNGDYDDVIVVKKNLDADFNFPNEKADFDEDYKEPTPASVDFCIKKEHVMSIFAYLEWSYRQDVQNVHSRRKSLLVAYGLIHNIVQNMIRMISENRPKMVVYSGHDKTLQPLMLALGINHHSSIQYASRMIFEVYRKKDLRDEFMFTKRRAVAQDFYFRVVFNGEDVTHRLSFCKGREVVMKSSPSSETQFNTYLCSIENIVRFIHDDYFSDFNVSNYKDACATYSDRG